MEANTTELRKQFIFLGISLIGAFVFWFLPIWAGGQFQFSIAEQFLMSITSFIAITLLDVIWIAASSLAKLRAEHKKWIIVSEADMELNNIRAHFSQIAQGAFGKSDVFINHYMQQLHNYASKIKHTAERSEMRVEANHLLSVEDELEAFNDDSERILKYTWLISSNERLFGPAAWTRYFEQTTNMVKLRQLNGIHVLLVVPSTATIALPRIRKLLDFFRTFKGLQCRIVSNEDFANICMDNAIDQNSMDFGLYARRLVFVSDSDGSGNGLWTKDLQTVRKFVRVFDIVWQTQTISKNNPSACKAPVSLAELFAYDASEPE